jgi:Flp pilus assembly protein TadG
MKGDRGAAALEMALVLTLITALVALTAPLAVLFQQKIGLERVAGAVARFATEVQANTRYGVAWRRPTLFEVTNQATTYWNLVRAAPMPVTLTLSKDPTTAKAGDQIEVTATTTVDLGPFGSVLKLVGLASNTTVTVTAEAVGRQE